MYLEVSISEMKSGRSKVPSGRYFHNFFGFKIIFLSLFIDSV